MYVSDRSIASLAASAAAVAFLFAAALILPGGAGAETASAPVPVPGSASEVLARLHGLQGPPQARAHVEPGDDIAALDAIGIALTQASDGATYVWRRGNGRLVGAVRPTSTFRDADRRICRHLEMELRLGAYTRRTEGIACRSSADGVWELEG